MKRSIHWINQINSSGCEIQLWDKKYTIWFSNRDFKEAERDAEILINCLSNLAENEQLRAQLAEKDKDFAAFFQWEKDEYVKQVGRWKIVQRLEEQLSQAQETIADFRSALEKMAKINPYHLDICATGESLIMRAKETLSKHPDSTEVK